jgi:hypothetical protein
LCVPFPFQFWMNAKGAFIPHFLFFTSWTDVADITRVRGNGILCQAFIAIRQCRYRCAVLAPISIPAFDREDFSSRAKSILRVRRCIDGECCAGSHAIDSADTIC